MIMMGDFYYVIHKCGKLLYDTAESNMEAVLMATGQVHKS